MRWGHGQSNSKKKPNQSSAKQRAPASKQQRSDMRRVEWIKYVYTGHILFLLPCGVRNTGPLGTQPPTPISKQAHLRTYTPRVSKHAMEMGVKQRSVRMWRRDEVRGEEVGGRGGSRTGQSDVEERQYKGELGARSATRGGRRACVRVETGWAKKQTERSSDKSTRRRRRGHLSAHPHTHTPGYL